MRTAPVTAEVYRADHSRPAAPHTLTLPARARQLSLSLRAPRRGSSSGAYGRSAGARLTPPPAAPSAHRRTYDKRTQAARSKSLPGRPLGVRVRRRAPARFARAHRRASRAHTGALRARTPARFCAHSPARVRASGN